jgi:hypothetical protein
MKSSPAEPNARAESTTTRRLDGLQVEGFAKVPFAALEELLTAASAEQCQQWAEQLAILPDHPEKQLALIAFYNAWLALNPDQAIRSLRRYDDVLVRASVLSALHPPPVVLPQLVELIAELTEPETQRLLPHFLAQLGEVDPLAAAQFLDSHPQVSGGDYAATLISTWAADDVAAARRWLEGSRFANDSAALLALVTEWAARDPAGAQAYLVQNQGNASPGLVAAMIESAGVAVSPELVSLAWRLRDPEQRDAVLSSFLATLAEQSGDPARQIRALGLSPAETKHLLELAGVHRTE